MKFYYEKNKYNNLKLNIRTTLETEKLLMKIAAFEVEGKTSKKESIWGSNGNPIRIRLDYVGKGWK